MKGFLLGACLLASNWLYAQCTVLSFDVEVVSNVTCPEGNDGFATAISMAIPFGGTTTYEWSAPGYPTLSGACVNNLYATTYTVTMNNDLGCTASQTIIVSEPSTPQITATIQDVSCFGMNDGQAVVAVAGNTMPYSINWGAENPNVFFSGVYPFEVTDNSSCVFYDTVIIGQPDEILFQSLVSNASCNGVNDGGIDLIINTPGNYTLLWSTGEVTEDLNNLSAGFYDVTITNDNNCSVSETNIEVLVPEAITLSVTTEDVSCFGENNGSAELSVTGGITPVSVDWGGFNTDSLVAGNYIVTITDNTGCQEQESFVISEADQINLNSTITDATCFNYDDGGVLLSIDGGEAPYTENWFGEDATSLFAGEYEVSVSDANGCLIEEVFTITEPDSLSVAASIQNVSCFGGDDGVASLSISGGIGEHVTDWLGENSSWLAAGVYQYVVSDANNCEFVDSVLITEPEALQVEVIVQNASCFGFSDGVVESVVSGGTSPYWHDWKALDTMAVSAGNYDLLVVDAHACETEVSFEITDGAEIFIELEVVDATCFEGEDGVVSSVVSGGLFPYLYLWSNGLNDTIIEGLSAGTYDLLITDEMGCEQYASMAVEESNEISIFIEIGLETCNGNGDGSFTASVQGGVNPYMLEWSNGAFGEVVNNVLEGDYSLLVIDANGCLADEAVSMTGEEPCFLIPTLFTPNADSYNDVWNVQGMGKFTKANVQVYNRTGLLVFSSTGYPEAWDGTYNGSPMPMADYYYLIDLQDGSDPLQGIVTLKR